MDEISKFRIGLFEESMKLSDWVRKYAADIGYQSVSRQLLGYNKLSPELLSRMRTWVDGLAD